MYENFFGINQKPFSIAPDPSFMYMSEGHREALALLRYGLENEGGFVLLTGEIGTGKTTVCRCLLEQVPENTNIAFILNPKLTARELLLTICEELGVEIRDNRDSIKDLIDGLNRYLMKGHSERRRTVLIIDEAQNLNEEVLEQVRLLTNLETNQNKLLQVIMLGQPELQNKLARPALKQLAQRISARHHLGPLSYQETRAYVLHRLKVAGMNPGVFTSGSFKGLFSLSGGIPRLINMICDRALLAAYSKGRNTVESSLLKGAAKELFGEKIRLAGFTIMPRWQVAGLTLLVCAILLLVINLQVWRPRQGESVAVVGTQEKARILPAAKAGAESIVAPVANEVTWPEGELARNSEEIAFKTLLGIWGVHADLPESQWACQLAEERGLRCLAKKGSIDDVLRLNRPVVLRMKNDRQDFFMVMTEVSGEGITFRLGTKEIKTNFADLALHWAGNFVMIWRPPPGYFDSLRPGHAGEDVRWLSEQLALIYGEEYNGADSKDIYDHHLVEQVKKLQFANKLVPDGIAGKETLITINTLIGGEVPVLRGIKKNVN